MYPTSVHVIHPATSLFGIIQKDVTHGTADAGGGDEAGGGIAVDGAGDSSEDAGDAKITSADNVASNFRDCIAWTIDDDLRCLSEIKSITGLSRSC